MKVIQYPVPVMSWLIRPAYRAFVCFAFPPFETSNKEVAGRAIFPFRSAPCFIMVFCLFYWSVAVCSPFGKYVLGFGNSGTVRTPIIDSEYTGCYRMGNAVCQSGLVVRCWFSIIFSSCTFYFDDSETGLSVVPVKSRIGKYVGD